MAQNDGWNVISVTPSPKAPAVQGDGWNVVSAAPSGPAPYVDTSNVAGAQGPLPTPANYSQSPAATGIMQPATWGPGGKVSQKLLGDQPLRNSGIVVGQHLKNAVMAPYHAFTDAPANPQEAAEAGTDDSSNLLEQGLGHVGLGFARMLVNPTLNAGSAAIDAAKAGDYNTAGQRAMDAIPVAGPWARQVENDAQTYGAIPSLLGLGTDLASAKAVEPALKTAGYVANKVGRLGEFVGADPAAQKLMASRIMIPGSPGELLQRGLKPDLRYGADPSGMLQDTLPSVIAQDPNVSTVGGYAKAADAARDAQGSSYDSMIAPYRSMPAGAQGTAPRSGSLFGGPIADAQMSSIPLMDQIEKPGVGAPTTASPQNFTQAPNFSQTNTSTTGAPASYSGLFGKGGIADKTAAIADNYRKGFSIPDLDQVRQDANAKLNAFYNKAAGDRNAALSNPETARVKAVGDTSRALLYDQLAKDQGITPESIASGQQLYGKLSNVADIANKRDAVFSRHDPVSLAEKIATSHGGPISRVTNYIGQKALRSVTDNDALVGSAVDRFKNPLETPTTIRNSPLAATVSKLGSSSRLFGQTIGSNATALKTYTVPALKTGTAGITLLPPPTKKSNVINLAPPQKRK
jgi:hypothetical protein